jgi:hypothetical protein
LSLDFNHQDHTSYSTLIIGTTLHAGHAVLLIAGNPTAP